VISVFRSIRAKLIYWYSFILLTTLVAFGLTEYMYSGERLAENLDRSLRTEVVWVKNSIELRNSKAKPGKRTYPPKISAAARDSARAAGVHASDSATTDEAIWKEVYAHALSNPKKTLIEVTNRNWGAIEFRSFGPAEDSLMAAAESLMAPELTLDSIITKTIRDQHGMELRVAAAMTPDLEIFVAYPLADLNDALGNLFSIFLILIPAALMVSVGGGWLLAYKSLKPVDLVTKTAHQITVNNLNQRIPERDVNDEIGRLISTFNEMIARLSQSFDQIKQFSIDASHELRTPLTIMRGEVELSLRSTKDPEEYRRVLVSNLEELLRLSSIVDGLLTMSKADFNQQDIQFGEVHLKDLLAELYEDGKIIAMKKNVGVELRKNEDVVIMGDRLRLHQLLLNLLDNAIKYTPENGHVSMASERQNGFIKVRVADSGVGIPRDQLQKIFDRFYRVDRARSREMGGSGLGLAIAKWIAELHRGHIDVESEVGKGSTFTVFLPL
jgi:heavy metal sensor kinase